ncbi:hypothetical protein ZIOFF_015730 [Zingiber officinale]|uniref:Uncharacterized protein n=1 Tax=Zingiber officinale TaxID=94328 RepID=A0A8J5LFK2_ZINOF|nr:hypothetical protein ZIOFF_015730 [Zingiber officinale]
MNARGYPSSEPLCLCCRMSICVERSEVKRGMCPLRVLLIFFSATVIGFFLIRNLKIQPSLDEEEESQKGKLTLSNEVRRTICSGFWTRVDMASGRYLWRIMASVVAA